MQYCSTGPGFRILNSGDGSFIDLWCLQVPHLTQNLILPSLPELRKGRTEQHCYKCASRKGFEAMPFTFLLIMTKPRKPWRETEEMMLCLDVLKNAKKKKIKKLFQNAMLHFKFAEHTPRIQFEMKNLRSFVTYFHYTLPNVLLTQSPSEISEEQIEHGVFPCGHKFYSHRTHFAIATLYHLCFS